MTHQSTAPYHAVTFFDVDGTLVWRDYKRMAQPGAVDRNAPGMLATPPTRAIFDAFRRMRERDNATFICTGRPVSLINPSLLELDPTGVVAAAGAYIRVGDTVVRDLSIPEDLLRATVQCLFDAGIDMIFESNAGNVEFRPSGDPARFPGAPLARTPHDMEAFIGERAFNKFCSHLMDPARYERARPFIEEHYTFCDLQGGISEFSMIGVDKGSAIDEVLRFMGRADNAETYAFGDSENDLSMAGHAATFVAMGNALPAVKERADYVTDSAADDGVATGLAHFGLI